MIDFSIPQQNVMRLAIDTFGIAAQSDIAQEECAELIQAISKFKRYGLTVPMNPKVPDLIIRVKEEIADVLIMAKQMQIMLDIDDEEVQAEIGYKINKFYKEHLENRGK